MGHIVQLNEVRDRAIPIGFTRRELSEILALYATRVAAGEWRDYAIDHRAGSATFSVFRRSQEGPVFTVVKCADPEVAADGQPAAYQLFAGPERLGVGSSLSKVLAPLVARPILVRN
jgi:hypothetical protein